MNKQELARHIDASHPQHIWPKVKDGLARWTKEELEGLHRELHDHVMVKK